MKALIITVALVITTSSCITTHALSGEVVTRVIESDVPMIMYGHWLHSPYTVVLTDSTITVNGYLYERPQKKEPPPSKPDRKKGFVDWLVRTPMDSARALIDAGGKYEDAVKIVEDFFRKYEDGDTLKVEYGVGKARGAFRIKYYKDSLPVGVFISPLPHENISHREGWLEPRFKEICTSLERGSLIIRGHGYEQSFPKIYVSALLPELKKFKDPQYARSRLKGEWIEVKAGNYSIRLMKEAVEDIMNPKGD